MRLCFVTLACLPLVLCAVHKFELGDSDSDRKVTFHRHGTVRGPTAMSKEEIHQELHALRQQRSAGQPVPDRYNFHDQHNSGMIQYSGTEQKVIFVLTYTPNANGIPLSGTNLYKSTNYGQTFTLINNRLEPTGTLRLWNNFFINPEDYNQIVFPHATDSKMYVTRNEGSSFSTVNLPNNINPRTLDFNPTQGEWFIAVDSQSNLWLSEDLGSTFIKLTTNVLNYYWGVPGIDSSSVVYFWNGTYDATSGLTGDLYSTDPSHTSSKLVDPNLGKIEGYAMVGSYIFTQKSDSTGTISLWVSHNRGQFHPALIPSTIPHQNYFVSSIQDFQALVIVEHADGVYTLYMSGEEGEIFSESLPDLYNAVNGNGEITFDLELLNSMNGTFIANQILRLGSSGNDVSRRTLISFDNGGNWNIIQPPVAYKNGTLVDCEPPACSLHFHMASSEYWRTGVYSQASAPGIIIAHGTIGSQLSNDPDLYLSRDGGVTWLQALLSTWGVSVLDYGGLIVAAADYHQNPSSVVQYTCDEGLSWTSFNFGSAFIVYGVLTEPGEMTTIVTLYGWESGASGWISVRIEFAPIFDRNCTGSDYYNWEPYDENLDVDCLNGATVVIERRKPDSCCLSGKEYERQLSVTTCPCTFEDYQCDYGYKHSDGFTGPCVRDETISLSETCADDEKYYLQSSGYRKIPGDVCEGGVSSEYDPVNVACCDPPSTVTTTQTITSTSTLYTSTITSVYPDATATTTLTTTVTSSITVTSFSTITSSTTIIRPGPVTTTTMFETCAVTPVSTSSSEATSSSANTKTIFLAIVTVVSFLITTALTVVTIVLAFKLYKKRAANGYSSVSTHYHADLHPDVPSHEANPGVAINHAADDSDEGEKDDDLLIP